MPGAMLLASIVLTSAVPARLGLKALALAWPEVALASSNTRPGQSIKHGLALAWPGLGQGFLVYV